jgi:hypothetical protein
MRRISLAIALATFVLNINLVLGQGVSHSESTKAERAKIAAQKKELAKVKLQVRAIERRAQAEGIDPSSISKGAGDARMQKAVAQAEKRAKRAGIDGQIFGQGNPAVLANVGQGAGIDIAALLQNPQAMQQFVAQLGQTFGQGFAQGLRGHSQFSGYGFPVMATNFGPGFNLAQASQFGQNLRSFAQSQLGAFPALQGRIGGILHLR